MDKYLEISGRGSGKTNRLVKHILSKFRIDGLGAKYIIFTAHPGAEWEIRDKIHEETNGNTKIVNYLKRALEVTTFSRHADLTGWSYDRLYVDEFDTDKTFDYFNRSVNSGPMNYKSVYVCGSPDYVRSPKEFTPQDNLYRYLEFFDFEFQTFINSDIKNIPPRMTNNWKYGLFLQS